MACNNEKCTCKNINCERHGKCCECITHHLETGTPVNCMKALLEKK